MAKIEHREGTDTEGRGLGHSFAADNVDRGDPNLNQFVKRRLTYPLGDNPRGREIDWNAQEDPSQIGDIFRVYKGLVPIVGQDPFDPKRVIRVGSIKELRPALPSRTVDSAALDAAKESMRAQLSATDFGALFPSATVIEPAPGASVSRGSKITIRVTGTHILSVISCTLYIDGKPVDRRELPRSEQGSTPNTTFIFIYDVPADRPLGTMSIEGRVFSIESAVQGPILSTAENDFPGQFRGAVGSQDGRLGQLGGTSQTSPQLKVATNQFLRTPEGISAIDVNVI